MTLGRLTRSSTHALAKGPAPAASKNLETKFKAPQNGLSESISQNPVNSHPRDSPSTPPKAKRVKRKAVDSTPVTPTPAQVSSVIISYSTGDIDDATPPPLPADRFAEPHITNAPLKTPGGSRLVTYTKEVINASPSKTSIPRPTTTTGNLLKEACDHLIKVDSRLKPLIEKYPCRVFSPEGLAEEIDPFRSLSSGIMAQQVSGAAAKSIKSKFITLFNQAPEEGLDEQAWGFPTPAQVAACEIPFLRQAGLSLRKAEYIKGLAEQFVSGELSARMLIKASYKEVLEKLTAVRGLGKWSVEMFACFGLKRMDVFSTGDLGVQ